MSNCYNGYMVNNNNMLIARDSAAYIIFLIIFVGSLSLKSRKIKELTQLKE